MQANGGRWRIPRFLLVPFLIVGLTAATYAYTVANTVDASKAGDGTGVVTGYAITAIDYNLNATAKENIDSVTATIDVAPQAGSDIFLRLDASTTDWYACTEALLELTCVTTAPQATVLLTDETRFVIAD